MQYVTFHEIRCHPASPCPVEFRRVQTRFHERGEAAWQHYERTGVSVPADDVLAKLQAKLDARRKQLGT